MTTEELKALRSRVLDAINRELQPTRMNDEELLKAITALVEREGRGSLKGEFAEVGVGAQGSRWRPTRE